MAGKIRVGRDAYKPYGLMDIPPGVTERFSDEGFALRWIRHKMGNNEDYKNIAERQHDGWVPVAPSEVPEMAQFASDKHGTRIAGSIVEQGDLMLCKAPIAKVDARREYYEGIARNNIEAVNQFVENNPMKVSVNSQTRISNGRSASIAED